MTEAGLRVALHLTARTTFVFFMCAFAGNALRDLWPGKFSIWLSAKRDWFLLATAASHTIHLAAIIAFFQVAGWSKLKLVRLLGGGFVYLLIYALALAAILRLRSRGESFVPAGSRFEAIALYLIWLIFALAFVPRIISGWPIYTLFGVAALAVLFIRVGCLVRHRRARASAAQAVR
jgi:methionine sulfoxide reductase heme-binding subunit